MFNYAIRSASYMWSRDVHPLPIWAAVDRWSIRSSHCHHIVLFDRGTKENCVSRGRRINFRIFYTAHMKFKLYMFSSLHCHHVVLLVRAYIKLKLIVQVFAYKFIAFLQWIFVSKGSTCLSSKNRGSFCGIVSIEYLYPSEYSISFERDGDEMVAHQFLFGSLDFYTQLGCFLCFSPH